MFDAGITRTLPSLYLPRLGPMIRIAARRAHPPVEWMTVEPARSESDEISKAVPAKKFAPQVRLTIIG